MYSTENGKHTVNYIGLNGNEISPEDYNAAGQLAFTGCEKSSSNFGWFRFEDAKDASCLTDSYAVFTGDQTPDKTNPLPVPQPLGQVDPQGPSPVRLLSSCTSPRTPPMRNAWKAIRPTSSPSPTSTPL